MRLFSAPVDRNYDGLEKAIGPVIVSSVNSPLSGFMGFIREALAGDWQKNISPETRQNIMAFSAVYACVTLIADDISKLRIKLVEQGANLIWTEVKRSSPFAAVLRKPNRYQNRIQFLQQWVVSKLMHGNEYILKGRDKRRVVTELYPLNPYAVKPLIADDGSVWYQINRDYLIGMDEDLTVPASEIIHDRCSALWHPLVGVSPIYAAGASATQGIRIQANSEVFFKNMSRPSGQLTAPGTITDETALRLKAEFEKNFSGGNIGRLLVTGDGLKYEPMTIPPQEAQLIEQLKWTVEDVARAFKVPLYKLGGSLPASFNSVSALNQDYYSQTLQAYIEAIELCLEEGLELPSANTETLYGVELDLEGLLRMDPGGRAEAYSKFITSAVYAPNEARFRENLPPVEGGDTPYLQQQNYSLAALAARDAAGPPAFGGTSSSTPSIPAPPAGKGRDIDAEDFERVDDDIDLKDSDCKLITAIAMAPE